MPSVYTLETLHETQKSDDLQDYFPFQLGDFYVNNVNFRGVIYEPPENLGCKL